MHANKQLNPRSHFPSSSELKDDASQHSSQTDLSDVGLCSLNIHEFTYNSLICLICLNKFDQALEKLNFMLETIPRKYADQLWLIRGQVRAQVAEKAGKGSQKYQSEMQASDSDMNRASKYDTENFKAFIDGNSNVMIGVFPQTTRLCSQFAFVKTPLRNSNSYIMLRPSFSFPFIKPPNMIPCVDTQVITEAFVSAKGGIPIQLKPEAPWIKKDAATGSVKFTDEIYITDANLDGCDTPDSEKEARRR